MISAVALLFAAGSAVAQDAMTTSTDGGIKATSGDVTLEANVNLLSGDVTLNNALNQIKGRYFLSDNVAFRLGANITLDSRTQRTTVATPGGTGEMETKQNHFGLSIMPGIEKHFAGTNRLSPYIGAELGIAIDSRNQETTTPGVAGTDEWKGSWGAGGTRGNTQIALNALAGFDFYVAQHLFLGYEMGFGLGIRTDSEVEHTDAANVTTVEDGKDSNFFISPLVRNGIRVGFVF